MLLLWTVLDPLLLLLHLLLTPARLTSRRPCSRSPRGAKTRPSEPEPESEDGWHDMVDEDEEPHQFPFCPRRTPEVQLDLQQDYSPLDLFRLFFSTDVLKLLCDNTNGNAARKHAQGLHTPWSDVDAEDMLKYLSIVLYLGLAPRPRRRRHYKLYAKVLAERLKGMMAGLVHEDQTRVVARMGLGPSFIRWVKILYYEVGSRVNINGHIGGLVRQRSGVRQGCPLSPLLYVLYMEPFAAAVRADPLVDGLLVPGSGGRTVKIAQYADDTALFLQSDRALLRALTLLDQFGEASGASLNRGKSTVGFFGRWKGRQEVQAMSFGGVRDKRLRGSKILQSLWEYSAPVSGLSGEAPLLRCLVPAISSGCGRGQGVGPWASRKTSPGISASRIPRGGR
ncbi:hypothetical protein SKAU_G00387230 [Synaphobranchus kaupii]|uniref:Reverse transcriptase domain-containing protein n=1 Tax=Synaphobranchus kaupii TaxID=118154 RepID=A0A9Q1EAV5_SYNKA|nr:hypothetical protein SKAU_G00387230 [Synaphobranchus kaupii]